MSSGALWDHGLYNTPFNVHNGIEDIRFFAPEYEPDTIISQRDQASLFQTLLDYHSARDFSDTSSAPSWQVDFSILDTAMKRYDDAILYHNAFPIVVYDLKYNQVDSTELFSNAFQNVSGYFQLNSSVNPDSVFPERTLFELMGTHIAFRKADSIPLVFSPGFIFTADSTLGTYEIDFGDGLGFRAVQFSSSFKLYYPESYLEDHTIWTLRKLLPNDTLYAYKPIVFLKNSFNGFSAQSGQNCLVSQYLPDEAPWPYTSIMSTTIPYAIKSTLSYEGIKAIGKAYIKYGSPSGLQNKEFKKPVIILDGIDFGDQFPAMSALNNSNQHLNPLAAFQIGNTGWPMLWGCKVEGLDFEPASPYIQEMLNNGYDIIFLDFWDSTDDMRRNAMLLIELIERVNANKVGNEEIVIIGPSMGGQIARYALSYMEQNNMNHCVRLNVAFDSPWKGAIIPLGVQSFIHYSATEAGNASALDQWRKLNHKAPQQLLRQHLGAALIHPNTTITHISQRAYFSTALPLGTDEIAFPARQNFLNDAAGLGNYPRKLRNVAILNGADNNNISNNSILNPGTAYINHIDYCYGQQIKVMINAVGLSNGVIGRFNFPKRKWHREYKVTGLNFWEGKKSSLRIKDLEAIERDVEQAVFDESPFNACITNITVLQEPFGFIPSISALNLSTNDPDFVIDNVVAKYGSHLGNLGTHFDAFLAPDVNQTHIQATNENMLWLLEQIEYGSRVEDALNGYLDISWNIPLEKKEIGSFTIVNGGELNLYHNAPRFDGNFDPLSTFGSNIIPPADYITEMFLGIDQCSSPNQIHIMNGGQLNVGEKLGPNTVNRVQLNIEPWSSIIVGSNGNLDIAESSKIIVHANATLDLRNNSSISIADNAKIVIEVGGTLLINGNPSIVLSDEAQIIIRGKLKIEDNGKFYYDGNGTIQFEQSIPFVNGALDFSEHCEFGQNTKFRLIGTNGNRPQLKVVNSCYLRDAQGKAPNIQLINTDIEINPSELLYLYNDPFINNVTVDIPTNASGFHEGIRIWGGVGTTVVKNSSIRGGSVGLWAQWTMATNPIVIQDCDFENNYTGLKVEGGGFSIYNCDFSSYSSLSDVTTGIQGIALQSSSVLRNSSFFNLKSGAELVGTSNSTLDTKNNSFVDCDAFGSSALSIQQMTAELHCNTFTSNSVGVLVGEKAHIYMNENAFNVFNSNDVSILFKDGISDPQSCGLYLKNGKNQFNLGGLSATAMHILGHFECQNSPLFVPYIQSVYSSTNPSSLDATGNFMEERQFSSPTGLCCTYELPVSLVYKTPNNGPIQGSICDETDLNGLLNTNSIVTQCASSLSNDLHPLEHTLQMMDADGGEVQGGGKLKELLIEAIKSLSYSDSSRNDIFAFNQLAHLSNATISNSDSYTSFYQELAYSTALTALENAYHSGQLTSNEGLIGSLPDSSMQSALSIIDYQLAQLNNSSSEYLDKRFIHHLNKVLILRNGGYTHEALTLLSNAAFWTDPQSYTQSQRVGYWDCILTNEHDYYQETISIEEWAERMNLCAENFVGYNYKNDETFEVPQTNNGIKMVDSWKHIQLYPQPSSERIFVDWEGFSNGKEMLFNLYTMNGIKLKSGIIPIQEGKGYVIVQDLVPGMYILEMQSESKSKRQTIIVE